MLNKKVINIFILSSLSLLLFSLFLLQQNRKVIPINSKQLLADFRKNDSVASFTYAHLNLEVNGILYRKQDDKSDALKILLSTYEAKSYIYCDMRQDQIHLVNELIPGMEITVNGECDWDGEKILLKRCILVKP